MPMPIRLEVFETVGTGGAPQLLTPEQIEEIRLNAYERGYNAGWDDAGQQAEEAERASRAEVERQLQQLSFTYHEARGHLLRALAPVFEAMLNTVVPAAARKAVVPMVVEQLLALSGNVSEAPVTLRVHPESREAIEAALDGLILPPMTVTDSEEVAPLQATISLDAQETHIDLAAVAEELAAAIDRFYLIQTQSTQTEEVSHG